MVWGYGRAGLGEEPPPVVKLQSEGARHIATPHARGAHNPRAKLDRNLAKYLFNHPAPVPRVYGIRVDALAAVRETGAQ
jgi:hypothetical protein